MMAKLAQAVAQLDGKKTQAEETVTELYKQIQKPALFLGYTKTYEPYSVTGQRAETQPPETQMVQARFVEAIAKARKAWQELIDGTYTVDVGNQTAKADVIVDGNVLVKDVPVTTIMFLIKRWTDVLTFLQTLPTPDPSVDWEYDANAGLLRSSDDQITQRTQKVLKVLVKFAPTDKHPGQSDVYSVDEPVGEYHRRLFTGGCPKAVKDEMVERAQKVVDALKVAREVANGSTELTSAKLADKMFDYVLGPLNNAFGTK